MHAHRLSLSLPSRTVVVYVLAVRADTLALFLLYPYVYSVVQTVRAGPEHRVGHHLPHQGHPRPAGHRD